MPNNINPQGNANKNHHQNFKMRYHLLAWLLSKRKEISVGKNVEKREPLYTVGGIVNWYSYYGKQYGGSSKKKKHTDRTTRRASKSTSVYA